MVDRHRVKITVLRRFSPSEVFEKSPVTPVKPLEACGLYTDDQEFIIGENLRMPEGFCSGAWHTIYCTVRTLAFGGNLPWYKEKGVAINCCIDGPRPVVFNLNASKPQKSNHLHILQNTTNIFLSFFRVCPTLY